MNRLLTCLLLLVLLAACTPPGAAPLVTAGPTPTPVATEHPLWIDGQDYAGEYGLAMTEAVRRLQLMETVGDLGWRLEQEAAGTFGGLWFEHEPEFHIVAAFTDNGQETIRPYIDGQPYAAEVEVRQVELALSELRAARDTVGTMVAGLQMPYSLGVSITDNQVTLEIGSPEELAERLAAADLELPAGVVVVANEELVSDLPQGGVTEFDGPDGQTIYFPQQAPSLASMAALMEGELIVANGCLRLADPFDGPSFLIIWPNAWTLLVTGDEIAVVDAGETIRATVGEVTSLGGGAIESSAAMADVDEALPGLPLAGCPGPYWIAAN